jgi:hypothetical protein
VPAQHRVGRRPADARAGRALVCDLPPGAAQVRRGRERRPPRRQDAGALRGGEAPVAPGLRRGDAVEDALGALGLGHATDPKRGWLAAASG